jgi:hypothetical protein
VALTLSGASSTAHFDPGAVLRIVKTDNIAELLERIEGEDHS